ncbi:hypothetical protein GCM10029976_099590 [Kribbella albertanoniae]
MGNILMQTDLSVWGMYQHADIVVKCVMIGLILASVVTWAIFFSKSVEFFNQKRRLKREQQLLAEARSLNQANDIAADFGSKSLSLHLLNEAQNELELSEGSDDNEGIKERTSFRLERRVAAVGVKWAAVTAIWQPSRDFAVRWSVWYGLGHHEQLYWYRAADH